MKELIKRHLEAIKKRGLITDNTKTKDFVNKLREEVDEVDNSLDPVSFIHEMTDVAAVAINAIEFYGYDFLAEYEANVEKNEQRALIKK